MKLIFILFLLTLSACSKCNIPNGDYQAFGGSETATKLELTTGEYKLTNEYWKPSNYEKRIRDIENGKWSCSGNMATLSTKMGSVSAEFQKIGNNPLSLPVTTKALVFKKSDHSTLSSSILYPSGVLD